MGIFSAPRWDEDSVGGKVLDEKTSAQKKSAKRKSKQLAKKAHSPAKVLSTDSDHQLETIAQPQKVKKTKSKISKKSATISLHDQEAVVSSPSNGNVSKRQKRRLNLKMKLQKIKLLKLSQSNSSTQATVNDSIKKLNKADKTSTRVQGKIDKLLEIRKKKNRAKKAKKSSEESVTVSHDSSVEIPEKQTNIKAKLKRRERRQKRKEALAREKELKQANEIILSKKNKKKMKKIAKRTSENQLNQIANGVGTANPSFDTSLTDMSTIQATNESQNDKKKKRRKKKNKGTANSSFDLSLTDMSTTQAINDSQTDKKKKRKKKKSIANSSFDSSLTDMSTQATNDDQIDKKKKRKKKKNKIGLSDSVDGNLVSSSSKFSFDSNTTSSKNVATVSNPKSILDKSLKKKVVIAKLLQESNINETDTLHDLKKKRLQERVGAGTEAGSPKKRKKNATMTLREKMTEQLKSSRFRWLNEQLYTSNSWEAMKYFKEDPEAFEAYHSGYRNQVTQWPVNPLDVIIESISSLSKDTVVADFGCGEARLAASLPHLKVHSLDLIASKPGIVACDMAHTPLLMESVDVAVFCLSLMGTNLNDFLLEANRVLKNGGMLMIAEVESRFEDVDNFTSAMVHFGFQLKKKDLSNQMFIFMDFKKTRKVSKTGKLPTLTLDPCVYKKR